MKPVSPVLKSIRINQDVTKYAFGFENENDLKQFCKLRQYDMPKIVKDASPLPANLIKFQSKFPPDVKFDHYNGRFVQFWDKIESDKKRSIMIPKTEITFRQLMDPDLEIKVGENKYRFHTTKIFDAGCFWCAVDDTKNEINEELLMNYPVSIQTVEFYTKNLPITLPLNIIIDLFADYGCIAAEIHDDEVNPDNKCFKLIFEKATLDAIGGNKKLTELFPINITEPFKDVKIENVEE